MAKFILSEQAVTDVDVIHAFICADDPDAADRVEEAIFAGFDLLARNPALGGLSRFPRHKNIRCWVVTEFPSYLIFYRALPGERGLEIIRVLHGARNLGALLG